MTNQAPRLLRGLYATKLHDPSRARPPNPLHLVPGKVASRNPEIDRRQSCRECHGVSVRLYLDLSLQSPGLDRAAQLKIWRWHQLFQDLQDSSALRSCTDGVQHRAHRLGRPTLLPDHPADIGGGYPETDDTRVLLLRGLDSHPFRAVHKRPGHLLNKMLQRGCFVRRIPWRE